MTPLRVPENISRIEPYIPGKPVEEVERELGLSGSVKLASNENPLGPSPRAVAAARAALDGIHRYPDGSGFYLKRRLSEIHAIPAEQILLGNGSAELVEILARTFLGGEGNAVIAEGAFLMYRLAVMAVNGNARLVPLRSHRHDLEAMAGAVDRQTRLIFIANPNNPTGTYVPREAMARFMETLPEDLLVVLDEAYHEYVVDPDYPDGLEWVRAGRRVAVLRTFSKIHGLAGLRIGYAFTTPEVRLAAEKVRSPFNTSSVAQAAALAALDDPDHVVRSREHNQRELRFLQEELGRRRVSHVPSVANFILLDSGREGQAMYQAMLGAGVIVRPMGAYAMPRSLRVTVGTHAENVRFLEAFDAACLTIPPATGC